MAAPVNSSLTSGDIIRELYADNLSDVPSDCEESEDEYSVDNSSASVVHLCGSDAVNDTFIAPCEQSEQQPVASDSEDDLNIALACELRKPLFLHEREAHNDLVEILEKHQENLPAVVLHCFTGSFEQAQKYLQMGMYLGITGYLCKDKSDSGMRKLLESGILPLEQLMVETDSPFMYPNTRASKLPAHVKDGLTERSLTFLHRYCTFQRNEPCSLPAIVEMIAAFMKKNPEDVALATAFNALKVFGLS